MTMPTPTQVNVLYDQDSLAWTEQQAQFLRLGRLDQLDLENLIAEIESFPEIYPRPVHLQKLRCLPKPSKSRLRITSVANLLKSRNSHREPQRKSSVHQIHSG
ncbi:DUF29 family protein [Thermosynechococcaceae cyanobacterium BACA0444]|uniref:DUF29 family protein n=1 Tax=Pseudocalidococcus azoricus BACA0444 TaxID=2918990 RepID=A0AAE4FSB9_9CYAN|nr:DUF29 family protein [Pseudocalidococcus azoricus]MDS3861423.1 DUF29 family protein [Pseudocalidococcus azoricus BACA0444]